MAKGLTPKQQAFVAEYLVDLNGSAAARRAGYSAKNADKIASELLGKTRVREAIAAAMEERSKRVEIDADYVLTNLLEIVERCMQRAPVVHKGEQVVDEEGNSVWCFDGKNAIRALELLGKHKGMWVEKQELTGANGGPIDNQLTIRLVRPGHADS